MGKNVAAYRRVGYHYATMVAQRADLQHEPHHHPATLDAFRVFLPHVEQTWAWLLTTSGVIQHEGLVQAFTQAGPDLVCLQYDPALWAERLEATLVRTHDQGRIDSACALCSQRGTVWLRLNNPERALRWFEHTCTL